MKIVKIVKKLCPACGSVLEVEVMGDVPRQVTCGCGHRMEVSGEDVKEAVWLGDCEIRDWERFGRLSPSAQQTILTAMETGSAPRELYPLLIKLKEYGILVCT